MFVVRHVSLQLFSGFLTTDFVATIILYIDLEYQFIGVGHPYISDLLLGYIAHESNNY